MRLTPSIMLVLGTALHGVAHATVSEVEPHAITGKVLKFALCPMGHVDGMVLDNHAFVRLPPHTRPEILATLRDGPVEVTATVVARTPNLVLEHPTVRRSGRVLLQDGPPPPEEEAEATVTSANTSVVEITAAVVSADTNAEAQISRLILEDGTTVHLPRGAKLPAATLPLGKVVTVHGVSKHYEQGRVARADGIVLEHKSLLTSRDGSTWTTQAGTVARVWVTPHGDVDGVLLQDGSLVRFHPLAAAAAANLTVGIKVTASGAQAGDRLQAETLLLNDNKTALDLDSVATHRPGPGRSLPLLAVDSEISKLWLTPKGDTDALLTADGTLVHIPPHLHELAAKLKVGQHVLIQGRGGRYPQGVAVEAASIGAKEG